MSKFVSAKSLAEILGITERRVNQLTTDEKVLTRDPNGKFDVQKNVYDFFKNKFCTDDKYNYDKEKALHEKVKREKAELQLKVMKGELHRSEDVAAVMTDMIVNARTKLLSLPSKVAPMVIGYKDITRVQGIIQKYIEETLQELGDYDSELFTNDEVLKDESNE